MKTLVDFVVIAMILFASCAKDAEFKDNSVNPDLKSAKVPIPIKADLFGVPDMESEMISLQGVPDIFVPSIMKLSGKASHMGILNPEKSYYEIKEYKITGFNEEGDLLTFQSGTGILVGANGDSYLFTWEAESPQSGIYYTGSGESTGGTGKFEGCTGKFDMVGKWDLETLTNQGTVKGFILLN